MSKKELQLSPPEIEAYSAELRSALQIIPEVTETITWIASNPSELTTIVCEFLRLFLEIDSFTENDLETIKAAERIREEKGVARNSASKTTASAFLAELQASEVSLYQQASTAVTNVDEKTRTALKNLSTLMYKGHTVFANGRTPKDGDAAADEVIWGHTQMIDTIDPTVVMHFIMAHFFAQYFLLVLSEFNSMQEKDDFFNPLSSAVLLHVIQEKTPELTMEDAWLKQRAQGGLSWLKPHHIEVYTEALKQTTNLF